MPRWTNGCAAEWLDVTLAVAAAPRGHHPPGLPGDRGSTAIFADMGFCRRRRARRSRATGTTSTRSTSPPEHPARQEQDTFFMARAEGDNRPPHVLRTHTSPVQIRVDAGAGCADPRHRAGPGLSHGHGPDPHADVPPDRGPRHRPRPLDGEPEMGAGGILPAYFGHQRRDALPRVAFPLHRTLGRGRHPVLLGRRPAEGRRGRRLDGGPGLRHGASQGAARPAASTRTNGRASPSAWASTGSPC